MLAFTCSVSMDALLLSAVGISLPHMMGSFSASLDEISWVATVYLIGATVCVPLSSWFSQVMGGRRFYLLSTGVFLLASLGCAMSPTLGTLLFFRALQGAGASPFRARALLSFTTEMSPAMAKKSLLFYGNGLSLSAITGFLLGGWLSEYYSWRLNFLLPVFPGLVAMGCMLLGLEDKPQEKPSAAMDWPGFGLLLVGLGSLQTMLGRGQREDWFHSTLIVGLGLMTVTCLALFLWRETRVERPLLNLGLMLKDRNLAIGMVHAVLLGLFLNGGLFVLPTFLRSVLGHNAVSSGRLLCLDAIGTMLCLMGIMAIVGKVSPPKMLGMGAFLFGMSMALFAWSLTSHTPDESLLLPIFLRGLSLGFFLVPVGMIALGTLPRADIGDGRALYYFFRQLGGAVGVAFLTLMIDWRASFHSAHLGQALGRTGGGVMAQLGAGLASRGVEFSRSPVAAAALLKGRMAREMLALTYSDIFLLLLGFAVLAAALVLLLHRPRRTVLS